MKGGIVMVRERASSARAAKVATIVYVVVCSVVLPLGVAGGVLGDLVIRTCVEQPEGAKVAAFRQGTKTYYTYPRLLAWRRATTLFVAPGVLILLTTGGIAWWLRRKAMLSDRPPDALAPSSESGHSSTRCRP